ncbi:MAG: hypothetical protein IPK19_24820 [Chloroflexi bacterium]|nr:hypothetical protein [Chloroflexota bacterium]
MDDDLAEASETIHFDEFEDPDMPAEKEDFRRGLTSLFNRGRGGRDKRDKGEKGGKGPGKDKRAEDPNETIHFDNMDDAFFEAPTIIQSRKPQDPVEIPQNELDAFLQGFDSTSAPAPSTDDIEDPDIDLFVERRPDPASQPEPDFEAPMASEDSLSWLSEIDSMVTAATRALDPRVMDNIEQEQRRREGVSFDDLPSIPLDTQDDEDSYPQPRGRTAGSGEQGFSWDLLPEAPEAGDASTADDDWLSGIEAEDAQHDETTTRIPRPVDANLPGLLKRSRQPSEPAQPPPTPQPPARPSLPAAPTPGLAGARSKREEPPPQKPEPEDEAFDFASLYADDEIAEKALDSSGWNIPADLVPEDRGAPAESTYEVLFDEEEASDSLNELEEWERIVQSVSPTRETPQWEDRPGAVVPDDGVPDDDVFGDLDSSDIPEEELHSGWLTDALLDSNPHIEASLPPSAPAPAEAIQSMEDDDRPPDPGTGRWELPPSTVEDDLFDLFQASSDTIDLGEFDAIDAAPAGSAGAMTDPVDSVGESGSDTIDFGQWDLPGSSPAIYEPGEGEGIDTIDFGQWDSPQDAGRSPAQPGQTETGVGEGVDTLDFGSLDDMDFGSWEASQPRVPSAFEISEGEEIETLKFGEFDTPESQPASGVSENESLALDALDFGTWETSQPPVPGDYQPAEGEEIDTLKFGEFDTPAEDAIADIFQAAEEEEVDTLDFEEFEEDPAPAVPPKPLPVTTRLRGTEELRFSAPEPTSPEEAEEGVDTFDFGTWEDDPSLSAGFAPGLAASTGEEEGIDTSDFGLWSDDQPFGSSLPSARCAG